MSPGFSPRNYAKHASKCIFIWRTRNLYGFRERERLFITSVRDETESDGLGRKLGANKHGPIVKDICAET